MQNAATSSLLYGKGIFTTIAVRGGRPLLWDKHWRRLSHNAEIIGIEMSAHTEASVRACIERATAEGALVNGRLRITFADESSSRYWPSEIERGTTMSIVTGDLRAARSLKLAMSRFRVNSRSPLIGVKSCNYLEHLMALDEAQLRGFHEAIRLNEDGLVTSGCMANVFWVAGGRLYTPALSTGCLPGTTREFVLENVECDEVEVELDELSRAEAIFLSSAGLGVTRVDYFDGREMPDGFHPIQQLI